MGSSPWKTSSRSSCSPVGATAAHYMTLLTQGFATIENCCTSAECDSLAARLTELNCVGSRCLLDNEWCQDLALRLKSQLSKSSQEFAELIAVQCTFFNKSATANWLVAYHQDRSIPATSSDIPENWPGRSVKEGKSFVHGTDELLARMLAVRLHLDDSTPDNGPLRVIPGSHGAGTLSPERIQAVRDSSPEVELTVHRGGVILMRPLLLHASSKSRTNANRRVLHFLFAPPTCFTGR